MINVETFSYIFAGDFVVQSEKVVLNVINSQITAGCFNLKLVSSYSVRIERDHELCTQFTVHMLKHI